jgi:hypothetical protein
VQHGRRLTIRHSGALARCRLDQIPIPLIDREQRRWRAPAATIDRHGVRQLDGANLLHVRRHADDGATMQNLPLMASTKALLLLIEIEVADQGGLLATIDTAAACAARQRAIGCAFRHLGRRRRCEHAGAVSHHDVSSGSSRPPGTASCNACSAA